MARKQMQIPGTERTDVPPAVAEAGDEWMDLRRAARRARERAKEAKLGTLALMKAHKVEVFAVKDPDTEEVINLRYRVKDELITEKTHEADDLEVGEGEPLVEASGDPKSVVHPGLIAQAEASMAETGVEESDDGDVVTPDRAAPKKPRKKSGGKAKGRKR